MASGAAFSPPTSSATGWSCRWSTLCLQRHPSTARPVQARVTRLTAHAWRSCLVRVVLQPPRLTSLGAPAVVSGKAVSLLHSVWHTAARRAQDARDTTAQVCCRPAPKALGRCATARFLSSFTFVTYSLLFLQSWFPICMDIRWKSCMTICLKSLHED